MGLGENQLFVYKTKQEHGWLDAGVQKSVSVPQRPTVNSELRSDAMLDQTVVGKLEIQCHVRFQPATETNLINKPVGNTKQNAMCQSNPNLQYILF